LRLGQGAALPAALGSLANLSEVDELKRRIEALAAEGAGMAS